MISSLGYYVTKSRLFRCVIKAMVSFVGSLTEGRELQKIKNTTFVIHAPCLRELKEADLQVLRHHRAVIKAEHTTMIKPVILEQLEIK